MFTNGYPHFFPMDTPIFYDGYFLLTLFPPSRPTPLETCKGKISTLNLLCFTICSSFFFYIFFPFTVWKDTSCLNTWIYM